MGGLREPRSDRRLGVIVNPIAGMGGRVGLKGTDGPDALREARQRGAMPVAPDRAKRMLDEFTRRAKAFLLECGVTVVSPQSPEETRSHAVRFRDEGVDLLAFVGGDGTARDLCAAISTTLPVVGVPAGVKMHSAVFAVSPEAAALIAVSWLLGDRPRTREGEVVDIDEDAVRSDRMDVRLYGSLLVPDLPGRMQALKASGARPEAADLAGLAADVAGRLVPGSLVVLGPGTTARAVAAALEVESTLLGIDVVEIGAEGRGRLIARDAGETEILTMLHGRTAVAVLSPTGGQGFLLGRGNQQLSPAVLRAIGPDRIVIAATPGKLAAIGNAPLYVDTGDAALDAALAGHRRVITGRGREAVVRIAAA